MEINEDGFLEELLALRRETWESSNPTTADQINGFFSSTPWPFDGLDSTPPPPIPNSTTLDCSSLTEFYSQVIHSTSTPLVPGHQIPASLGGPGLDGPGYPARDEADGGDVHVHGTCKPEPGTLSGSTSEIVIPSSFNIGVCSMERSNSGSMSINHHNHSSNNNNNTLVGVVNNNKSKVKKVEGQPSKNLMAERRRRKRLNDRLSMLRSVVPKISKMDRTSILGDTIDYMKELLERINSLQEEIDVGSNPLNVMSLFKDAKPSDVLVRNSPKFDVERRNLDTRVEICCAGKPGLLLSTVTTLETLGLEIQQCVISCFNDFSLQASCSEEMEQRSLINSEDIKQALFRNAGYGGRCL